MERDELVGELRLLQRCAFELLGGERRGGEERVGRGLAQRPGAAVAGIMRHLFPFEGEEALQPVEQRRGQRAVVMFDLAEIGGRDAEMCGELSLLNTAVLAQRLEAVSGKDPLAH